jgi:glycerol kinase
VIESTGLGAAFLAGLGAGMWASRDELAGSRRIERTFTPGRRDEKAHRLWRAAVERAKGWALET